MIQDHFDFDQSFVSKKRLNFKKSYRTWCNALLERTMNIFTWNNLPMPQKEIELLLTYVGFCGFTRFKKSKELGAVNGSMTGVTNYPDIFTRFVYATPLESGIRTIDTDLVVIDNNQIRMPTFYIVDTYASLLAHTDLSLQAILINSRATGLVKAKTQEQVDDIAKWYNALANGKTLAILDAENLNQLINDKGIEVFSMSYPSGMTIDSYYQIRENLLKSFYSEIGINSNREKRERMITEEVDANLNRILFNVDDMLESRQQACEKINSIFNTNISVDLNKEIVRQLELNSADSSGSNSSTQQKGGDNDDSNGNT